MCKQLELVRGMMGLGDVHTVAGGVAVGVLVVHIVAHNRSLFFLLGSTSLPEGCDSLGLGAFCPGSGGIGMERCGNTGKMYKAVDGRLWKLRIPFWVPSGMSVK